MSAAPVQVGSSSGAALVAAGVIGVVAILILPVPPLALDALLAVSIGASVLMLMVALSLTRAADFSVFPSLLLIVTLLRLSLNVATTRLILLHGSEGPGAAGHVVETFGRFAIGGSLVVGAVVFLILMVVNFGVIAKGSGRVSEVAARFTLDALPGKQMAIDADLAAGAIDEREARTRRTALEGEAEFFGAMDGASKFVRGDAVAGLAITAINIVAGLIMGIVRDGLSISAAAERYTLLTVGDGLVSQLPALLVSTAAGVVVTRAAGADLGTQLGTQVLSNGRVLRLTAAVLVLLGLIPGMPLLPFWALAGAALVAASRGESPKKKAAAEAAAKKAEAAAKPERLQDLLALEGIELEVGYGLVGLLDPAAGGELPGRIAALRKQLASDLGVVLPGVHLKDDLQLAPEQYRVRFRGVEAAKGVAHGDRLMAIDSAGATPDVPGLPSKEPAFGLPAVWIRPHERAAAEARGLTIVDPASVITTHLGELLRRHAYELVGRQEVQELLAATAKEAPKLVEDAVPGIVTLGELVRVVRGLLREGVSVRDLRTILEAVADAAPRSKEAPFLVEQARRRLSRQITARIASATGVVKALTLDRVTEEALRASLGTSEGEPALAPDLDRALGLMRALEARCAALSAEGLPQVLLAPPDLRRPLFDFATRFVPDLWVITARELTPGTTVEPAGVVQLAARGNDAANASVRSAP